MRIDYQDIRNIQKKKRRKNNGKRRGKTKMRNRICRICGMPIKDWRNNTNVHPDCELKEDIQNIQKRNRFDGTGQDDEVAMEE